MTAPAAAVELHLSRGDRLFIGGQTGSGKSVALRWVLAGFERWILADPKGRAAFPGVPVAYGIAELRRLWPALPRVIARPAPGEDRRAWLDAVARLVYYTGECAFAIDEILGIATDARPLRWVDTCETEGRELGITMIVATQRPHRIPLVLISEADAFLVFHLALEKDRERIAEVIGPYRDPGKRTFRPVYYGPTLTAAVECAPLPFVK